MQDELEIQVRTLDDSYAFVDLSAYRKTVVKGSVAARWLNDLVTAGIEGLSGDEATRSLLLTPTGRVLADFHVIRWGDGFLLIQDLEQPAPVTRLLVPYVLSSDVSLKDRTMDLALFAVPGSGAESADLAGSRPSILGPGVDVIVDAGKADKTRGALVKKNLVEVSRDAAEIWRIRRGIPRFPMDFGPDSIPAEAGLEDVIDFTKGCFLGQESVAKVRNLGHPPRVVLPALADGRVAVGERLFLEGEDVGKITSAARVQDRTAVLARVRWGLKAAALSVADGRRLSPHRG